MRIGILALGLLALVSTVGVAAEQPLGPGDPIPEIPSVSAEVAGLLTRADAALVRGSVHEAERLYRAALVVAPGNEAARRGHARSRALLGFDVAAEDQSALASVQTGLAEVEIHAALQRAELLAADGRLLAAEIEVMRARGGLEKLPARPGLEEQVADAEAVLQRFREQAEAAADGQRSIDRQTADVRSRVIAQAQVRDEAAAIDVRLAEIINQRQRRHFEVALSLARRLVRDYPQDPRAIGLYDDLIDSVHESRALTTEQRMVELRKEVDRRIGLSLIPTGADGLPDFPDDWFARDRRRGEELIDEVVLPQWQLDLMALVAQPVTVQFDELPVAEALEVLRRQTGLNIVIDPDLAATGGPPVRFQVRNMRIDHVLDYLTQFAETTWEMRDEVIVVGDLEPDDQELRLYDVAELVYATPDLGANIDLAFTNSGGGGGFDIFGGMGGGGMGDEGIAPEDIVDLIMTTVSPETWENGESEIRIRGNNLLVWAPPRAHTLVAEFLRSQLHARNTLVQVDLRWVIISDTFIEEIGVDWQNLGLLQPPPGTVDGFNRTQNEWSVVGNLLNSLPSAAINVGGSLVGEGLHLSFLRLGSTQLAGMLTAIDKRGKGRVLDSTQLTTINGVAAHAFFGQQYAYISDYDVAGNGNYDPVIEILTIGRLIDIRPFVSADRTFVTLELQPILATASFFVERITTFAEVQGVIIPVTYPIELPNVLIRQAKTSVTIPDQGSILVGGFGRNVDQFAQTRVPFLGHIPFLGRLFGKRGTYQERLQLYLSATVQIILYDEEEAKL